MIAPTKKRVSGWAKNQIMDLYRKGRSYKEIGGLYNMDPSDVRDLVLAAPAHARRKRAYRCPDCGGNCVEWPCVLCAVRAAKGER